MVARAYDDKHRTDQLNEDSMQAHRYHTRFAHGIDHQDSFAHASTRRFLSRPRNFLQTFTNIDDSLHTVRFSLR